MNQKSSAPPGSVPADKLVRDIRSATRKHHSAEDQISIVLEGLRIVRFIVHPFLGSDSSRSWRKNPRAGHAQAVSLTRQRLLASRDSFDQA